MKRIKTLVTDSTGITYESENQPFTKDYYYGWNCLDLDQAVESHKILGFGISMTDASCYMLNTLPPEQRHALLKDLFTQEGLDLSIARLNVGSSDYSTEVYCYNDTADDLEMKHFSIDRDREYLIPIIREVLDLRKDLYVFSSPWSPPGWMKTGGEICGGEMRAEYLEAFADYYVKYLQAYAEAGVPIQALTIQNEPETDQGGKMPQSRLHPDFERILAGKLLPEKLRAAGLDTKIWIHDHNYTGWKRVKYILSDPAVRENIDAVAWHPYSGVPEMMREIRAAYPELKADFQLTEKGPNLRVGSVESHILWWSRTISGALNNGCSSFVGWNCALDENGNPNLGPFDCAGLLEIHSRTQQITPSVQYHAFKHFSGIKRGALLLKGSFKPFVPNEIDCVVCRNPDGTHCAVLGNHAKNPQAIQLKHQDRYLRIMLRPESMVTVTF